MAFNFRVNFAMIKYLKNATEVFASARGWRRQSVHCGGKAWHLYCEVVDHAAYVVRKQRDEFWFSDSFILSLFILSRTPTIRWCHLHSGWIFPLPLNLSWNSLTELSRNMSPGDSSFSQLGYKDCVLQGTVQVQAIELWSLSNSPVSSVVWCLVHRPLVFGD